MVFRSRHVALGAVVVGASLALTVPSATAEEPVAEDEAFDLGSDDEAFDLGDDDEASVLEAQGADEEAVSEWSFWLTGFLRSDWALWAERFEENPLAKGRQSLDLLTGFSWRFLKLDVAVHAEYDVAYLVERDSYDDATLEAYEGLVNTREVQLAASLGDFELTVGRQIVRGCLLDLGPQPFGDRAGDFALEQMLGAHSELRE